MQVKGLTKAANAGVIARCQPNGVICYPLVPAKAGTQYFSRFPLSRE
jgi:hypothetical protein